VIVIRNTTSLGTVGVGADTVCAVAPMAAGAKLISVVGELHVIGAEAAPIDQFAAYGFSGEVIPVMDPDSAEDINALWDKMVTKTVLPTILAGTPTLEFDFDTADVSPDVEPGEVDMHDLTGMLDPTNQIIAPVIEWMSSAKGTPMAVVAGTPDTYTPRSYKTFRSMRKVVADMSSFACLAISSPSLDVKGTSFQTPATPQHWAILENLRNVMQDFWRINAGMIEAGAESPYAEISTQIGNLVAPEMVEAAVRLDPMLFVFMCRATWTIEFDPLSIPNTLDANNE